MKKLLILLTAAALLGSISCALLQPETTTSIHIITTSSVTATEAPEPEITGRTAASSPARHDEPDGELLTLSVLNVGKGDALLLRFPDGQTMMIDTGRPEDFPILYRAFTELGIGRLDSLLLSHGHKDHMGGLAALLSAFPVGEILYGAADEGTYSEGEPAATAGSVPLRALNAGDRLEYGKVVLEVLSPLVSDPEEPNNDSLVLRLTYGQRVLLLMGDAEAPVENALLEKGGSLRADLLKAGHHGKNDATTEAFFRAVDPAYLILTGDPSEDEDSPGSRVLALAEASDAETVVTSGSWLLWTFSTDGDRTWGSYSSFPSRQAEAGPVISELDRKAESVQITNTSAAAFDLSGYWLFSESGGETFFFPEGTVLGPGASLTVVSGKKAPEGDFLWSGKAVWKKSEDDAVLYDRYGTEVSRCR